VDACSRCVYQCSQCSNSTIAGCSSCTAGFYKHELTEKCEPFCPSGFFQSPITGVCTMCPEGCSACDLT
jgi:hypothetical protein